MNKAILIVLFVAFCASQVFAQSVERKIQEIAASKYPNDTRMQRYIYDQQLSAYKYMTTVKDKEVKAIALHEHPKDYSLQKYTYDQQLSAKEFMNSQRDSSAKSRVEREYPNDYSMQKYAFERIKRGRF